MALNQRSYSLSCSLAFSLLAFSACGGKSAVDAQNVAVNETGGANGGTTTDVITPSGGAPDSTSVGSGGAMSTLAATGGAPGTTIVGSGGFAPSTGGAFGSTIVSSGGIASGTGGASFAGQGGVIGVGGGVSATGGSSAQLNCAKTTCPAIPKSCKKLVQDPNACCPVCLDTGCGTCDALVCETGTHAEVVVGDCCPSCVKDPPDPCAMGQENYARLRATMLEKYGSTGCTNSSDCTLVPEDNDCAYGCDVALPTLTAHNFALNASNSGCSTCPAPTRFTCPSQVPACLNGKCVAVEAPVLP